MNLHSIVCLNVRELLVQSRCDVWSLGDCNGFKSGQMIDLCCEYLSVLCIRLYDIIMSRMSFRVNPHSIVEMHRTDKYLQIHHTNPRTNSYSQHSSIILRVWLNGWMFVYKLSGCGFESHCCHLKSNVYIWIPTSIQMLKPRLPNDR